MVYSELKLLWLRKTEQNYVGMYVGKMAEGMNKLHPVPAYTERKKIN
jgi:hypothetical protein